MHEYCSVLYCEGHSELLITEPENKNCRRFDELIFFNEELKVFGIMWKDDSFIHY